MRFQRYCFYSVLLLLACSCNTTKYLQEDETFLRKNAIKFDNAENSNDLPSLRYELESLLEQEPNSNYFFVPSRYFHYRNMRKDSSKWFNKWIRKNVAEPPAIYKKELEDLTSQNINKYLVNKKGYYGAKVTSKETTLGHYSFVDYIIDLGNRYKTKSMLYYGDDEDVIALLVENKQDTKIKPGVPLDALTFDLEKQRIISLLQNNGYADFNANYINIKGDSTNSDYEVEVFIEIGTPQYSKAHSKYRVGSIDIFTDHLDLNTQIESNNFEQQIDGVTFHRNSDRYIVKPSVIAKKLGFVPNSAYSKEEYNQTISSLGNLSAYRFVRIQPRINDSLSHVIDYNIFLTPQKYLWVSDIGTDLFYSTVNSISRRQVGLSLGGNLLNRNAFGGSETYSLNAETGVEFNISNKLAINTLSLSLQNTVKFPRLLDITQTFNSLKALKIISSNTYKKLKRKAQTEVGLGGSLQSIIDIYNLTSISATYGFDFQTANRRIRFRQLGVGLFLYDIKPVFAQVIKNNILIQKSLENNLFTGLFFNELSLVFEKPINRKGNSYGLYTSLETSGLEIALVNKFVSQTPWRVTKDIDFANFIKFSLDGRYYKEFNKRNLFAARAFFGIAAPYYNDVAVPFVKQFFVGGPNSMRAWNPRELGPGSYKETNTVFDNQFYQTGDLKLEFNAEYRTDLFYVFEGALFVDAGNVWSLSSQDTRVGSLFGTEFYKQIAIGAGFGIRVDFTYFHIRFDFGYKILNPYPDSNGSRWMFGKKQGLFGNPTIAINYPF